MRYVRLICVVILSVSVLVPKAWSQRAATEDQLDEAIETVRATMDSKRTGVRNFKGQLLSARRLLAGNLDQSLDRVTALLDDEEQQIKLNAAIILTEAAQRSESADAALLAALQRCLAEDSPAVAYWGLQGFMSKSVPLDKQVEAIAASLDIKRPRLVRLAAARLARDSELRAALPALIAHMKQILESYTDQVDTILSFEIEVDETGRALNPEAENPGYTGRSRPGEAAGSGRPVESPLTSGQGGVRGGAVGPGAIRRGPGPGTMRAPAVTRAPATTRRPSTRRGVFGDRGDEDVIMETRLLDPSKFSMQEVVTLIGDLQDLPSVYELHEIGYIVESLARENPRNPREKPFGEEASFELAPPWALAPCVEAAVAWLDAHRAEFPNAPVPTSAPTTDTDAPGEKAGETVAPAAEDTAADNGDETAAPAEEAPEM